MSSRPPKFRDVEMLGSILKNIHKIPRDMHRMIFLIVSDEPLNRVILHKVNRKKKTGFHRDDGPEMWPCRKWGGVFTGGGKV